MAVEQEKFLIPDKCRISWETTFLRLIKKIQNKETIYPKSFDNDVFEIKSSKDVGKNEANFTYKPTELKIYWKDHFFKIGSYMNQNLKTKEFVSIVAKCSLSLNKKRVK